MSKKKGQQAPGLFGMDSTNMDLRNRGDEKQFRENLRVLNDRGAKNAEQVWKRQRPMFVVSILLLVLILVSLVLLLFMARQLNRDLRVSIYGTNAPQSFTTSEAAFTATSFAVADDSTPTKLPPSITVTPKPEIKVEWPAPADEYFVNLPASLEVIVKQGEQGKAGINISVFEDNTTGLELTAMNFSTDASGKAVISFTPRQPGDFTLSIKVDDQTQSLLVHVQVLDSDADGVSDDKEELLGSDPFINNIFFVKAPYGLSSRMFSSPDIQLTILPDNAEVFFIPDKRSSNPQFSWLFIKLSYDTALMDIQNRIANGTGLSLFSQEDKKIVLYRPIECVPAESFDYSQLDSLNCLIVQPEDGKNVIWLFGAANLESLTSVQATVVPAETPTLLVPTAEPTATTFSTTESTPEPTVGNIVPVP